MTTRPLSTGAAIPAASSPTVPNTPSGRDAWRLYEREIATYLRELPRPLEQGHTGRHVLVKGDEVLSVWDTQADALQSGRERFGLDPIFVKVIDSRDPERFALVKAHLDFPCPS
jgi:hypothetical protein